MVMTSKQVSMVAEQHSRMVYINIENRKYDRAIAAVDRAFSELARMSDPLRSSDPLSMILSIRIATILEGSGINTVGDLCGYSRDSLAKIHQIRYKSVDLIERALQKHGFRLRRD